MSPHPYPPPGNSRDANLVFNVEMLPARHGDALLLEYGAVGDTRHVLIDGGPYNAYPALRDRLAGLPRGLELLVVSHIDADHIEGIVRLLQERAFPLRIGHIWFNAWRHLGRQPDTLGAVAGETLSALIERRRVPWNAQFGGGAVLDTNPSVTLDGGLTLTVLSPTAGGLEKLSRLWASTLRKEGMTPGSARQALDRLPLSRHLHHPSLLSGSGLGELARDPPASDDSVPNGSSIALLAEFGGASLLLCADAHPSVLEQSIATLLARRGLSRLRLDATKVAHHGSDASLSTALLKLLSCKHFLISTDGSYFNHPDDGTIARILQEAGPEVTFSFNYPRRASRFWNAPGFESEWKMTAVYPGPGEWAAIRLKR